MFTAVLWPKNLYLILTIANEVDVASWNLPDKLWRRLTHLTQASQLHLKFVTSYLSWFIHTYGIEHWNVMKAILQYLKGTGTMALQFQWGKLLELQLTCYCDADPGTTHEGFRLEVRTYFLLGTPLFIDLSVAETHSLTSCYMTTQSSGQTNNTTMAFYTTKSKQSSIWMNWVTFIVCHEGEDPLLHLCYSGVD